MNCSVKVKIDNSPDMSRKFWESKTFIGRAFFLHFLEFLKVKATAVSFVLLGLLAKIAGAIPP